MNDLLSVLALPAMWSGCEASEIAHTLGEALRGMLALDLVYVSLDAVSDEAAVEAALASANVEPSSTAVKHLSFSTTRLGLEGELGVMVAAAARADFPNAQDRLVLNVSANQATVTLLAERRRAEDAERDMALKARAAIDSIPGMVIVMTPEGAVETTNRRNLEYLGVTLEQLRDWGMNGIVHPDDLPHVREAFGASLRTGTPFRFEQRVRRHDGAYRWFDTNGVAVRDPGGAVARWYALVTDIEDRKRAETLLAGEKQLLEMIASGQALRDVLSALCKVVESVAPDCYCDIHPIDWSGPSIAYAVAPSLPASYTEPIAGTPLRAEVVPCGIAANENIQVISEDFDTDPRWCTAPVRNHVLEHGLRSVWSTPIRSKKGGVLGTLCIYQRNAATPSPHHQDIIGRATHVASIAIERLEAEEELRRSQASLEDAQHISLTGSFSWIVTEDTREYSEQLRRIFEFEDGIAVTAARIAERIHPDDLSVLHEKRTAVIEGHDSPEYEVRLRMPDGRVKYVRVFGRTSTRADGRLECIGAIQDITARRQAEDALSKVRSDLAHVTRVMSLGTLAASIAHEVNQPLSGIITNADTGVRMLTADPPDVLGALETARRTIRDGNRAADVVARLRVLFRKTDVAAETVDIHQAAREVIALSHAELRRHNITVQTDFVDAAPMVTGDRVQLQQVILNLLLNAADSLKAVEEHDRRVVVKTEVADEVVFSVRDNGVGLDAEHAAKVFDAFFTTKDDGMGIGLSVSQSIIERHGGRLRAESNEDAGATFSFSLPLVEARA